MHRIQRTRNVAPAARPSSSRYAPAAGHRLHRCIRRLSLQSRSQVSNFRNCRTIGPVQPAIDDKSPADSRTNGQEKHPSLSAPGTENRLGQRSHIAIVADGSGTLESLFGPCQPVLRSPTLNLVTANSLAGQRINRPAKTDAKPLDVVTTDQFRRDSLDLPKNARCPLRGNHVKAH